MAVLSPTFPVPANPFLLANGAVWAACFVYLIGKSDHGAGGIADQCVS